MILANSKFTARVFKSYFPSISQNPSVIYPGINISVYEARVDLSDSDVSSVVRYGGVHSQRCFCSLPFFSVPTPRCFPSIDSKARRMLC